MADDLKRLDDLGSCPACAGRLTATHMLTKSYQVDGRGRWQRHLADFAEDVVIVCAGCRNELEVRFRSEGDMFALTRLPGVRPD